MLGELTELRIQFLLDIEARLKYRQDEPALEIKMTRKGGEVLSYHFSKPEDASYYALKRSDLDHYFKVVEYTVASVHGEFVFTQVQVCEKVPDNAIATSNLRGSPFEHHVHQLVEPEHHGVGENAFGGDCSNP